MKEQNTYIEYARSELDAIHDETDWDRADVLTDEDIDAAARLDADDPPTDESFWKDATVVGSENVADYTSSSGNVFKDMGLHSPEERLLKATLVHKINCLIANLGLTQQEAAVFFGLSRTKMTELKNGRLENVTVPTLLSLLQKLNEQPEPVSLDYLRQGVAAIGRGNPADAVAHYSNVISLNPDTFILSIAYYDRGTAYREMGDDTRAIEDYTKAIELDPRYAAAYTNRGAALHRMGAHDHAIEDCNKAIQLNPEDSAAYGNRGAVYGSKGNYERAIEDFNKAIQLKPRHAMLYNNRGVAYMKKGDMYRAMEDYNRAIRLNPDDARAYYNRAAAWLHLRHWDQARLNLTASASMGTDVINEFRIDYGSVPEFEARNCVQLPKDIAAMLTSPNSNGRRDEF